MTAAPAVRRTALLSAHLPEPKATDRVEIVKVEMPPGQQAPLHFHEMPVVGHVVSGQIRYQLEGQAAVLLNPGDAFLEPARARVSAFDNASPTESAVFIACYLVGKADRDLITFL